MPCPDGQPAKITAPLDRPGEALPLIEAGADELYCGVHHAGWAGAPGMPNLRFRPGTSLGSFREFGEACAAASRRGVPVLLALNSPCHFSGTWAPALADLEKGAAAGAAGFIISDPRLLAEARRLYPGLKLVASSFSACFNSEAGAAFAELGADRLVLPRDLTLEETGRLSSALKAKAPAVELEVFVQNITCRNVNSFCRYHVMPPRPVPEAKRRLLEPLAGLFPSLFSGYARALRGRGERFGWEAPCLSLWEGEAPGADGAPRALGPVRLGEERVFGCAVCGLFHFGRLGVSWLKIVGRGLPSDRKVLDVRFAAGARAALAGAPDFAAFSAEVRRLRERLYGEACLPSDCHYPCMIAARAGGGA